MALLSLVISVVALTLSFLSYRDSRASAKRATEIKVEQLFAEALDLMAGEAGTTTVQVWKPQNPSSLELARRKIDEALVLDRASSRGYALLATYLTASGRPEDAERASRKAIALEPTGAHGYHSLAASLLMKGELAEAEAAARRAVDLQPLEPLRHQWVAALLMYQGRTAEAIPEFEKAISLPPRSAERYQQLAGAYAAMNRWADAVGAQTMAAALAPADAHPYVFLGFYLYAAGRRSEGAVALDKAAELDLGRAADIRAFALEIQKYQDFKLEMRPETMAAPDLDMLLRSSKK